MASLNSSSAPLQRSQSIRGRSERATCWTLPTDIIVMVIKELVCQPAGFIFDISLGQPHPHPPLNELKPEGLKIHFSPVVSSPPANKEHYQTTGLAVPPRQTGALETMVGKTIRSLLAVDIFTRSHAPLLLRLITVPTPKNPNGVV